MITKNFKQRMTVLLQTQKTASKGYFPFKNTNGNTHYGAFGGTGTFPTNILDDVKFDTNSGIWIGSGNTPPTENDYALEQKITSGLTTTNTTSLAGVDENGDYYIKYVFTLTNTTSSDIVVREIGYIQQIMGATTEGGIANNYDKVLLDRTVLDSPVTIPASGSATIEYTLKTTQLN